MSNNNIVKVEGLVKSFGEQKAVNEISFEVEAGQLFSFLGENGAGKSTTINMMIGLLQADRGKINYANNESLDSFKNKIGIVFQNNILDDKLKVEENLDLYSRLYIKNRIKAKDKMNELLELLGIGEYRKQYFGTLSGGQKRKVEIAKALLNSPMLLFLDEPTSGLDPKTRREVWQTLNTIRKKESLTIFLTTHYMEETSDADKIVIIKKGKIICDGSPVELKSRYSSDRLYITPFDAKKLENQLRVTGLKFSKCADTYDITIKDTLTSIDFLTEHKNNIKHYEAIKGNMDDVFLNVVGKKMEVD